MESYTQSDTIPKITARLFIPQHTHMENLYIEIYGSPISIFYELSQMKLVFEMQYGRVNPVHFNSKYILKRQRIYVQPQNIYRNNRDLISEAGVFYAVRQITRANSAADALLEFLIDTKNELYNLEFNKIHVQNEQFQTEIKSLEKKQNFHESRINDFIKKIEQTTELFSSVAIINMLSSSTSYSLFIVNNKEVNYTNYHIDGIYKRMHMDYNGTYIRDINSNFLNYPIEFNEVKDIDLYIDVEFYFYFEQLKGKKIPVRNKFHFVTSIYSRSKEHMEKALSLLSRPIKRYIGNYKYIYRTTYHEVLAALEQTKNEFPLI